MSIRTPLVGYDEIVKIFALLLIMGINQLPTYKDYFSGVNWCHNKYASLLFTRDRFMFILKNLHFNEPGSDKLTFLVSYLNKKFTNLGRNFDSNEFVIDESLISFSGRLSFKQYLPSKASKYGIKVFRLCLVNGFVLKNIVYQGEKTNFMLKDPSFSITLVKERTLYLVMCLMELFINDYNHLYIDNYFTSVKLANILMANNTYMTGTFRKNRKGIPETIKTLQVEKGKHKCIMIEKNIYLTKFNSNKETYLISTKYPKIKVTKKKEWSGKEYYLPKVVDQYNYNKVGVDLADQINSYSQQSRKTVKWYRKVAFDMILGVSISNIFLINKKFCGYVGTITDFRKSLIKEILFHYKIDDKNEKVEIKENHRFVTSFTTKLKRCQFCYEDKFKKFGSSVAKNSSRKTNSYCLDCGEKWICKTCFISKHNLNK